MKLDLLFSRPEHPVVIKPEHDAKLEALCEYLSANRGYLEAVLLQHGGILFRGFRLNSVEDFRRCADSLGAKPFTYIGGDSPRTNVAPDVFTATEYPSGEVISLHQEMSYLPRWPRRVLFYCLTPAKHGGQTSIGSGRDVIAALSPDIVNRFREKRVRYLRHFKSDIPLGKSWQKTYQTQDRDDLERIVAGQGGELSWLPNGVLRITNTCESLTTHLGTGEEVWFNQAEQWHPSSFDPATRQMLEELVGRDAMPHDCTYGDGAPLEQNILEEIRLAMNRAKLLFNWERQDFLVIDNVLMMHGRESYRGERKTYVYLSEC
jgi:hypothetical protein